MSSVSSVSSAHQDIMTVVVRPSSVDPLSLSLSLSCITRVAPHCVNTNTHSLSVSLSVSLSNDPLSAFRRVVSPGCAPDVRWVVVSSSDEMLCMLDVSIVLSSIRHSGMSSE